MNIKEVIKKASNPEKAKFIKRYFKTGKGEYSEGDIFIGITVPVARKIAHQFAHLSLKEIQNLISSKIHEERFIALEILVYQYDNSDDKNKKEIYEFYLANTKNINNWDLVDTSAEYIVGVYLFDKDKSPLYKLAKSSSLWERRISIISTFNYIKRKEYSETLKIAEMLLADKHDLIHKAIGWMLREIGKKDLAVEEQFLKKHYKTMPRTMLRYAIERFSENIRKSYLNGTI